MELSRSRRCPMVNQSNALSLLFCYFKITALYHWADTSLHIPLAVSIVLLFYKHNSLPLGRYISCRAPHPIPFMSYLTRSPPPKMSPKLKAAKFNCMVFFSNLWKRDILASFSGIVGLQNFLVHFKLKKSPFTISKGPLYVACYQGDQMD